MRGLSALGAGMVLAVGINKNMRVKHGWIYREPGMGATPPRIKVSLGKNEEKVVKVFEDNAEGAQQAADYISAEVGDSWKLEDCTFLGARIFTEFP